MTDTIAPIAALTTIRVQSFEDWRPKFEATTHVRKGASILGHHIWRSVDDKNLVYVYFFASDRGRLDSFLGDPELPARLRTHGVSDPTYVLVVLLEDAGLKTGGSRPAALVTAEIEDYDRWKAAFDARANARRQAGIVGHAVAREVHQPNRIGVFLQAGEASQLEYLRGEAFRAEYRKAGCTILAVSLLEDTGDLVRYA